MTAENCETKTYSMREVSKLLDTPAYTLRRYCNSSLLPGWRHSVGVRRSFTTEQVERLRTIAGLHKAGLTTKEVRQYLDRYQDVDMEARRYCREILATHKRQVWQELEELQKTIDFLERQEDQLVLNRLTES